MGRYCEAPLTIGPSETGVPIPPKHISPRSVSSAVRAMEVGESRTVVGVKAESMKVIACRFSARIGRKYEVRPEGDGFRVWRVR